MINNKVLPSLESVMGAASVHNNIVIYAGPNRINHSLLHGAGPEPLTALARAIREINQRKGFWDEPRNLGEMLMLAVSELSEALEEDRSGQPIVYFKDGKPEGVAVEIIDCIIRLLDTLTSLDLIVSIEHILLEKLSYNNSRPYKHGREY